MTANVLTNIGVAQGLAGRLDLAAAASIEAHAMYQKIHGDDHPLVAKELGNIGIYYAQQGKRTEARPYFENAVTALTRIYGPEHHEVARGLMNLGLLKLESGDPRGAIADLEQAAAIHGRGPETPSLAVSLYHLANARGAVGQFPEARQLLLRVIRMDEKFYGAESSDIADDLEALAVIERELGKGAEADRLEARMRRIRDQLGATSPTP